LVNKAKSNIIAFQTIDKFLTALDKNVHKIEDDLLCELSVNILDKQSFKDMITRFIHCYYLSINRFPIN
jgi:hypothetical protein